MIYGYARVSTKGQARDGNSLDAQISEIEKAGAEKGNIYVDSFTGTKLERPAFTQLREKLCAGDTLIVTKLDRLGRSVSQVSGLINDLLDNGITVNVLNIGVMSNDSVNTLLRNIQIGRAHV